MGETGQKSRMQSAAKGDEPLSDVASIAARKKVATLRALNVSIFMSVVHMVITIQTEPLIMRQACKGDMARAMALLGNTAGLINLLSLVVNQFCGRLSDAIGRRTMFLIGPSCNMLTDILVYTRPSLLMLVACRVLRSVMAGISSSLMLRASMMDTFSGPELGLAESRVGSIVGMAVLTTPFLETLVLQRSVPRSVYLVSSLVAAAHLLHNGLCMPETLVPSKRAKLKDSLSLQALNPMAFLRIFSHGSKTLRRLVRMTTLQYVIEGKNLQDFEEVWKREHLHWGTEACRNEIVIYGICCTVAGETVHPTLLRCLSPRGFTSVTNVLNAIAFFLRGLVQRGLFFLGSSFVLLPGVNGASATALNTLVADHAKAEGRPSGEISASLNQLRSIMRAVVPAFIGNFYSFCRRRNIYPGVTFMILGVVGAVLPQALLQLCDEQDLQSPPPAADDLAVDADSGTGAEAGIAEKEKEA